MRGLNPGISVPHSVVIFARQKPVPPKSERLREIYVKGVIGANLTNEEKRAHLIDLKRERLIDQVCPQEILPPEKLPYNFRYFRCN
jgi:hypothetical protein